MDKKIVKDLMIPINEYAQVNYQASILDAILVLEKYQENVPKNLQPYRAVLVVDYNGKIVGKVGHFAFLKAFEPKAKLKQDMNRLAQANLTPDFIKSMEDDYQLWTSNFIDVCKSAENIKVKDVMHPIFESVDENTSIFEAIHKLVEWQTLSVLVTRNSEIVGICRLSDIYDELAQYVKKSCNK